MYWEIRNIVALPERKPCIREQCRPLGLDVDQGSDHPVPGLRSGASLARRLFAEGRNSHSHPRFSRRQAVTVDSLIGALPMAWAWHIFTAPKRSELREPLCAWRWTPLREALKMGAGLRRGDGGVMGVVRMGAVADPVGRRF
ncbi:hypothetical protein [Candidatus Accumulibacter sp. ACC007]|uniref:hypothetical protein n=1 Tax=Candidatus Accumulibacter sp. ACC007 TaxID=2823333 RepID=UPI0025BEEB3A|nr:hypothetical protein [Candidatus Accumulibacter sp. ACC007]